MKAVGIRSPFPGILFKTFVKQYFWTIAALQQIRTGPVGSRVRFAELGPPQERKQETLAKPKENEGFLEAPLCFLRGLPTPCGS